jgi:hypothetical protein
MVATTQRPDLFFYSPSLKQAIIGELTSPGEDRVLISQQIKLARYKDLQSDLTMAGWETAVYAFEVGSRGFTAPSLRHFLRAMGLPLSTTTLTLAQCSRAALCASYIIYLSRSNPEWRHSAEGISPQ